jgi:predicted dienelactone hydrolase
MLTRDPARIHAHSLRDADLSPRESSYPVVMMRPELAALTTDYTSLAEDLASHGYVVAGFDAPYRNFVTAFPDGRVISRSPSNNADLVSGDEREKLLNILVGDWTADVGFALDRLAKLNASDPSGRFRGRLDMTRVGVFGHSLGGATALQFCHDDPRCKAGIDIDGAPLGSVISGGVTQPFLFLTGDHSGESDAETRPVLNHLTSIYNRLSADRRAWIMLRGANHYSFSDNGAVMKSHVVLRTLRMLRILGMDGTRQLAIAANVVHTFFDTYVKGQSAAPLRAIAPPAYPEVQWMP